MKMLLYVLKTYSLLIELTIMSWIYMSRMYASRRKIQTTLTAHALLILLVVVVPIQIVSNVPEIQEYRMLAVTVGYCVACYVVVLALTLSTWKIHIKEALFLVNCSYLTQHLIHCLYLEVEASLHLQTAIWLEILLFVLGYLVCYFKVAPVLIPKMEDRKQSIDEIWTTLGVLAVAILLSSIVKQLSAENQILYMSCTAYAMLFCFYALWVEMNRKKKLELERKIQMEEQCFAKYKEQYELSQENITLINQKCHDLKYQIAALKDIEDSQSRNKQISELEDAVCIYDAMVRTGNEVLDTIMTEKCLYCEKNGITLACVADGEAVDLLDPIDTYTIFGNALDNALECVAKFTEKEKRNISVIVTEQAGLLLFQFENFYEELNYHQGNGYSTTKEDNGYHGFGLKSIQLTAEKYGGIVNISTEHHIFLLQVIIPKK